MDAIRANLATLGAGTRATVNQASVLRVGPAKAPHDLIMLDPPYETGAGAVAIDKLLRLGWIGPATWISLEVGVKENPRLRGVTVDAERKVGKARLFLLRAEA